MLDPAGWSGVLREAGFDLDTVAPFYGARAGAICSVLATQPARVLSALRVAPNLGRRFVGFCLTRTVRALAAADAATSEAAAGYVLITARKRDRRTKSGRPRLCAETAADVQVGPRHTFGDAPLRG
jgi:hypothetical protein